MPHMKNIVLSVSIIFLGFLIISSSLIGAMKDQAVDQLQNSLNDQLAKEEIEVFITVDSFSVLSSADGEKIVAEGYGRLTNPGEPFLPSKIVSIAIPPNAEFIDVEYDLSTKVMLDGTHDIVPIPPTTLSEDGTLFDNQQQRIYSSNIESIYSNDESYPATIVSFKSTSGYRSYNLVDVQVSPFCFTPSSGIVEYYPKISIIIIYKLSSISEGTIPLNDQTYDQRAKEIIYNFEQAQEWYISENIQTSDRYDFVIITLDGLVDVIEPLIQWESEKGRNVNVVTLSCITENYDGFDTPEKIRNFLREKYPDDQWGIKDVCIIGHWDDIPMRKTSQRLNFNDEPVETDFYYAELSLPDNESWDSDQDHIYGENNDIIDFYSEVTVGRIPWSDPDTVRHICEKSVAFEQNTDPSYKNNILLLANFVDENTDGATFMEYCVNNEMHPWMESWLKTRMYERESTYPYDYVLNRLNVVNIWSKETYSVVSWHSHGNPYGSGGFISVDDCQYLNDEYPAIISGASCSNSDTDYENIGQAMMKQGAIGFLGANKATPYQTQWDDVNDGSDQSLKYLFISSITSGKYSQGQAHQYALAEMYKRGLWDYLKYETFCHGSLFGNPDISIASPFANNPPETPETPEGPVSGKVQKEQTYITTSTDPDGDDIYYCFSWGDGDTDWFGPYPSGQQIEATHKWGEEGEFDIKVKAKDTGDTESDWSDSLQVSMPKNRMVISLERMLNGMIEDICAYLLFNR